MRRMAFRLKLEKLSYPNAVMCILLGLLMAGMVASGIWLYKKADKPVMRIGNYAITREHLALYQDDLRAKVSSYFYQTYQQDPNEKGFWDSTIGGETPSKVLRTEAVNALFTDTVERIEAARYEIEVDITLDDIKKSLNRENKRRAEPGQIAYGPETYGLMEYISRTQMEVRDALKEKLLETRLKPTKEQLQELYEQADAAYLDKGCKARVGIYMYYGMKVGEYPEELQSVWAFVKEELENGTPPELITEAAGQRFSTPIEYEEVEYDSNQLPRDNEELAWLAEQTRGMSAGQYSDCLDYGASQGILKVLDKTDYGKASFEEAETLLTNLWTMKIIRDIWISAWMHTDRKKAAAKEYSEAAAFFCSGQMFILTVSCISRTA